MIMRFLSHPYTGLILPALALAWIAIGELRRRETL